MNDKILLKERTNTRAWLTAITTAAVGGTILIFSEFSEYAANHPALKALLSNLGGVIFASVALIVVYEIGTKRAFFDEIMHHIRLADDVQQAGIVAVKATSNFIDSFRWVELFEDAKYVDVLVAYANTWRGVNRAEIKKFASKDTSRMRVILPDPDDMALMSELGRRFGKSVDEMKGEIVRATTEYISLFTQAKAKSKLEIWYHSVTPVFTAYRFDKKIVFTTYRHVRGQVLQIPVFMFTSGTLSDLIMSEIEALTSPTSNISRKFYPKPADKPPENDNLETAG